MPTTMHEYRTSINHEEIIIKIRLINYINQDLRLNSRTEENNETLENRVQIRDANLLKSIFSFKSSYTNLVY